MSKELVHDPHLDEGVMRKGFPRPLYDIDRLGEWDWPSEQPKFLPMPYSAQTDGIALLSESRSGECVVHGVCSVCGEPVPFEHGHIGMLMKDGFLFYESGPFHQKCLTITVTKCPHIAFSDGKYVAVMMNKAVFQAWQYHNQAGGSVLTGTPDELLERHQRHLALA